VADGVVGGCFVHITCLAQSLIPAYRKHHIKDYSPSYATTDVEKDLKTSLDSTLP
jgi:hypothetical protein